jgi:hypothetical protein
MDNSMELLTQHGSKTKEADSESIGTNHNHQLRNLLSIRRYSAGLQEHRDQLKEIEDNLGVLSGKSLALLGDKCDTGTREKWEAALDKINGAAFSINRLLNAASIKVAQKDRSDSSLLWREIEEQLSVFEESCKEMEHLGFEHLAESEQKHWTTNVLNFQQSILPLFTSHAMAYKVELQMIEKYTPEELSKVTQTILNHIPDNFTFEEAEKYEREYLKAMDDLEKEFHQEKNLWDTFLDILAGGTHQTPAERVMMNRWMDGEKGDLS